MRDAEGVQILTGWLRDDPDGEAGRLVFADYLEERDEPLAKFLRSWSAGQNLEWPGGSEVLEKGQTVFVTHTIGGNHMELWVRLVGWLSGQRVDWSTIGGRDVVRFLGDRSAVVAAVKALYFALRHWFIAACQKLGGYWESLGRHELGPDAPDSRFGRFYNDGGFTDE
jgi:uncharacterized protein (TIGR02996 family)